MTRLEAMRQLLGLTLTTDAIKPPRQIYAERDAAKLDLTVKKTTTRKRKTRTNVEPFRKLA